MSRRRVARRQPTNVLAGWVEVWPGPSTVPEVVPLKQQRLTGEWQDGVYRMRYRKPSGLPRFLMPEGIQHTPLDLKDAA